MSTFVRHPFPPVYDAYSRVLLLGTMPSPYSRKEGFYYGHPQNRFWPVLAQICSQPVPETNDEKVQFALRNRIALWDVLQCCEIEGARDHSIRRPVANDIAWLLRNAPIRAIFTTGRQAAKLYKQYSLPTPAFPQFVCPPPAPPTRLAA